MHSIEILNSLVITRLGFSVFNCWCWFCSWVATRYGCGRCFRSFRGTCCSLHSFSDPLFIVLTCAFQFLWKPTLKSRLTPHYSQHRLTNGINLKQHFAWSALGWMTIWQHQLPVGFWCILERLKGPTLQLSLFIIPTDPYEAPVPILSQSHCSFSKQILCTCNYSQQAW
jgi:hypothetical protein